MTEATTPAGAGERLKQAWERVSNQLDHIPGGMHANLEDAASAMWDVVDATTRPAPDLSGLEEKQNDV